MKTKVVATFASLIVHAIFAGVYFLGLELDEKPVESKAKLAASINLSMFEVRQAKPLPPALKQPTPLEQQVIPKPVLPKPVKKKSSEKPKVSIEKPNPKPVKKKKTKPQVSDKAKPEVSDTEQLTPKPTVTPPQKPVLPVMTKKQEGLSDAEREGLEDQYKNAVRQAILKNRVYPRQARRKRQKGTVVVAFRLQKNGKIENLRVVKSSGIEQLDKAALQAVEKVQQFNPFPKDVTRSFWKFEIPVSFRLS